MASLPVTITVSSPKGPRGPKTVLMTANMSGAEKPKLLVIGKSARPRGFPRNPSVLPVHYESTKKAWINGKVWEKFLRQWDLSLRPQNRKILLLMDNAPSHPTCWERVV